MYLGMEYIEETRAVLHIQICRSMRLSTISLMH